MEEKFRYHFDSGLCILFKYYFGLITISDIMESWNYALENNLIPKKTKGFVLDYRNANFNLDLDEYIEIPNFYKKNLDIFGNKKIAIITENANDIVVPMLVETKDEGYSSKPFSTFEAAINWVLG